MIRPKCHPPSPNLAESSCGVQYVSRETFSPHLGAKTLKLFHVERFDCMVL
jgi:hypothetical protein